MKGLQVGYSSPTIASDFSQTQVPLLPALPSCLPWKFWLFLPSHRAPCSLCPCSPILCLLCCLTFPTGREPLRTRAVFLLFPISCAPTAPASTDTHGEETKAAPALEEPAV